MPSQPSKIIPENAYQFLTIFGNNQPDAICPMVFAFEEEGVRMRPQSSDGVDIKGQ